MLLCQTPCTFRIKREHGEKYLNSKKKGYEEAHVVLGSSLNLYTIGNIFCTYGFTTDALTNGMWEYSPNNYYINMMPNQKEQRKNETLKKEIRRFILSNYDALRTEARSGKGEYIQSLSAMTGLNKEEIRKISLDAVSPVLLTEEIMERFEEEKIISVSSP